MKKLLLILILPLIFLFGGGALEEKHSLKSFTKPYAGIYSCTSLTVSGKQHLKKFKEIYAEISDGDTLTITTISKNNAKKSAELTYKYEDGNIIITSHEGRVYSDYKKGRLLFSYQLGLFNIVAVFERN